MAYQLLDAAHEHRRRCNGHELVIDVLGGSKFKVGAKVTDDDKEVTDTNVTARCFTLPIRNI